jgi:hypothetical protein
MKRAMANWKQMALTMGLIIMLATLGCSDSDTAQVSTGTFVDSVVEGLQYKNETQAGVTDEQGGFLYVEGEEVTFFVGGIVFGKALAKSIMTPVDIVEGAEDETVTKFAEYCTRWMMIMTPTMTGIP